MRLPGLLVNALKAHLRRPRPDIQIVELKATGGSVGKVNFSAYVRNQGMQVAHATISASVNGQAVQCTPAVFDLLVNEQPQRVEITVPRPKLGDLVKALDSATTLYGAVLKVEVVAGKQRREKTWREDEYDPKTDLARYEAQKYAWRVGRSEETGVDQVR